MVHAFPDLCKLATSNYHMWCSVGRRELSSVNLFIYIIYFDSAPVHVSFFEVPLFIKRKRDKYWRNSHVLGCICCSDQALPVRRFLQMISEINAVKRVTYGITKDVRSKPVLNGTWSQDLWNCIAHCSVLYHLSCQVIWELVKCDFI